MLDKLRLESYGLCCKMRVDSAVSLLGWVGIIISTLGLMAGIALVIVSSLDIISRYFSGLAIIIPLVQLMLNIFLIKRNSARSFIGVKNILRILCILCNVSLSLLLLVNYIVIPWIRMHYMYSNWTYPPSPSELISEILSSIKWVVVCITYFSLGIHGVRTNKKGLLNVYIIFSIVLMVVYLTEKIQKSPFIPYYPVSNDHLTELLQFSLNFISTAVSFFYNFGLFVVLYNMMEVREDEARELKLMRGLE